MGEWAYTNGWIGRILFWDVRDVWDVGYVYLCEYSEYKLGAYKRVDRAYITSGRSERFGRGVYISV